MTSNLCKNLRTPVQNGNFCSPPSHLVTTDDNHFSPPSRSFHREIPHPWNQVSQQQWSRTEKRLAIRFLFATIMPMAITRRQKEVIDFLSSFTQKNGYSPSYEEIASGLGLSSLATVHKHVTNLQNKGLLQRAHNRSRSIDVLPVRSGKKGSDRLPLLGRIAAGQPVEAIETAESISLSDIIGNREVFALEVRGDSMRDEHIVSGDYVLVERTKTGRDGELIVSPIDVTHP